MKSKLPSPQLAPARPLSAPWAEASLPADFTSRPISEACADPKVEQRHSLLGSWEHEWRGSKRVAQLLTKPLSSGPPFKGKQVLIGPWGSQLAGCLKRQQWGHIRSPYNAAVAACGCKLPVADPTLGLPLYPPAAGSPGLADS